MAVSQPLRRSASSININIEPVDLSPPPPLAPTPELLDFAVLAEVSEFA